jgi:hypothetical protein
MKTTPSCEKGPPQVKAWRSSVRTVTYAAGSFPDDDGITVQATVLGPPLIEIRVAHPVFAAQARHRNAGLSLFNDLEYLIFCVSPFLHS